MTDRGERAKDGLSMLVVDEVLSDRFAVNGNLAASRANANTSDAAFAPTGPEGISANLVLFDGDHEFKRGDKGCGSFLEPANQPDTFLP
jgi:hypothetical protein